MYSAFPSIINFVNFGRSSGISQYTSSPLYATIGCPSWDLITTTLAFPNIFLYLFRTPAIVAYSGEDVYWEIPDDLPKFTKLMIDGKALYIHRANFQIIDKSLLESN